MRVAVPVSYVMPVEDLRYALALGLPHKHLHIADEVQDWWWLELELTPFDDEYEAVRPDVRLSIRDFDDPEHVTIEIEGSWEGDSMPENLEKLGEWLWYELHGREPGELSVSIHPMFGEVDLAGDFPF